MSVASFVQHESDPPMPDAPEAVAGYADAEKIMALEQEIRRLTERLAAVEQELQRAQQEP
jgi:predicted  nucleic acid-binding Zn-ribbon protein